MGPIFSWWRVFKTTLASVLVAIVWIAYPIAISTYRNSAPRPLYPVKTFPLCAPALNLEQLSDAERNALAHTMAQTATSCKRPYAQCAFEILKDGGGKLSVHTDFFVQDPRSGECGRRPGGFLDDEYDAAGNFIETNPGV